MIHLFFSLFLSLLVFGCSTQNDLQLQDKFENSEGASWSYFLGGVAEENNENWELALEHFQSAFDIDPEQPRILLHICKCLIALEDAEHVGKYLQTIEDLAEEKKYTQNNDYVFYFDLARCYHQNAQYEKAKFFYQKCLQMFPAYQQAKIALMTLSGESLFPALEVSPQ